MGRHRRGRPLDCVLAAVALGVGVSVARWILVPRTAGRGGPSRAQELARYRTLVGFAFVALLSVPYRSVSDSLDKAWGSVDLSMPIALGVFLVLSLVFWTATDHGSRPDFARAWRAACGRVLRLALAIALVWAALYLSDLASNGGGPDLTAVYLVVFAGFIGLVAMGCWCISCHWFGMGEVHPLLPPLAAVTLGIMTGSELHSGGPEQLPFRLWLLINVAAVTTTLGVCFVEICDAVGGTASRGLPPARWPVAVAPTVGGLALVGTAALLVAGLAEPALCTGAAPFVRCADALRLTGF